MVLCEFKRVMRGSSVRCGQITSKKMLGNGGYEFSRGKWALARRHLVRYFPPQSHCIVVVSFPNVRGPLKTHKTDIDGAYTAAETYTTCCIVYGYSLGLSIFSSYYIFFLPSPTIWCAFRSDIFFPSTRHPNYRDTRPPSRYTLSFFIRHQW